MALHTGDVELQDGDYRGLVLHHASRMLAAAHGAQILCSEATATVMQRQLDAGIQLRDLGVYRLRDVQIPERLFQVEYPGMPQPIFPPPRADAGLGRTLPLQFNRFIGREKELRQLEDLLLAHSTRLVTMMGPGGTGKSRLALELAGRVLERFNGAVWFVPLADLSDPHRIVDAVLEALRLPRSPTAEPLEQVVEMLSRQTSLLVLDNFEHLVAEGASFVQTLLERVPSLTCLVTSRQRLDLSGEREFVVPPLQTPAGTDTPEQLSMSESVQLFIDRAQTVRPDFQVTNQNAAALAELCSRLEGIPLAIELAAARAQVLTPVQMLHQLARRFEFLVSRRRDGAKRHQTLHAAVEWSYRLLPPELQRFFARLSVFRGGWTLEAAEAVCEEPLALDYLAQLRECSLVLAEEEGDATRFRMLETLREFAEECLEGRGEAEAVCRQHARFFLELAARESDRYEFHGSDPDFFQWLAEAPESLLVSGEAWVALIEKEQPNLGAAARWAEVSGERKMETRLEDLIKTSPLIRTAHTILQQGLNRGASEILVQPSADAVEIHFRIESELHEILKLPKAFQQKLIAHYKLMSDMNIHEEGVPQEGKIAVSHSYREYDILVSSRPMPHGEELLLRVIARAPSEERLAIWRASGEKETEILSLVRQGNIARNEGHHASARSMLTRSLLITQEIGSKPYMALTLVALGGLEVAENRIERAARLFGAAEALRRDVPLPPAELADYKRQVAAARAALGERGYWPVYGQGWEMTPERAIAYALDETDAA